jgi:hypothetical protein
MRANVIIGTMTAVAVMGLGSIHGGWISGAGLWLAGYAPELMVRVLWQDFSCVLAAVHACAWLGTIVVMTVIAGACRR